MTPAAARALTPEVKFGKAYDARLLARLWKYVTPYRGLFLLSMISYPVTAAFHLAQPYLIKVALDEHLVPRKTEGFGLIVLLFVLANVFEFLTRFAQVYCTQLLGQRATRDLRADLFQRLQKVDVAYLEKNPIGRLITRVTNDVESLADMFATGAVSILGDIVTLTGIVVMMLAIDVRLTLYAFALTPILLVTVVLLRRPARDAFRDVRTQMSALNAQLNEAISGMSLIQIFRQERAAKAEFEQVNASYRDANFRAIGLDATTYAIVEGLGTLATAGLIVLSVSAFAGGDISIGVLVAFVDYLHRFFGPITELSTKYTVLQSAMASAERCFDLLDQKPSVTAPAAPKSLGAAAGQRSGEVVFESVDFAYGDGPPVLKGFDLHVKRGEKIAIVGPTGAGKSTIVKLLERFYDPSGGRILLDGVDLKDLRPDELRSKLALVLQDAHLFDGTIRDNISLGRELAPGALESAARKTRALEVIERLESGFDTRAGERGSRLSSGERQLVAFARALALDPEILVLDEATSSVDPETESRIQDGLRALIEDRTAIIIAHRLSTIRRVDRIVVIASGRIVEQGSHAELMAKDGPYRKLYELQFQDPLAPQVGQPAEDETPKLA